jgi:hypothetical protein
MWAMEDEMRTDEKEVWGGRGMGESWLAAKEESPLPTRPSSLQTMSIPNILADYAACDILVERYDEPI